MNEPITSDDPRAQEKLTARIATLEKLQERMVIANKIVRKYKAKPTQGQIALEIEGFTVEQARKLFQPDYGGRLGYPAYELQNNSNNMRRLKERLATIIEHANDVTSTEEVNGCTITDSVEEFRVQIDFPAKPSEEVRRFLKGCGFRWAPSTGLWQTHRSAKALARAREACGLVRREVTEVKFEERVLSESFNRCCDEFRSEIYTLADLAGKPWQAIYKLWLEYSERVGGEGGQSALLSEFRQWYAKDLAPAEKALWIPPVVTPEVRRPYVSQVAPMPGMSILGL